MSLVSWVQAPGFNDFSNFKLELEDTLGNLGTVVPDPDRATSQLLLVAPGLELPLSVSCFLVLFPFSTEGARPGV